MTPDELARRQHRATTEPMVIAQKDDHLTVYSPTMGGRVYEVRLDDEQASCTCPDFEKHQEDDQWRCKHVLAVLMQQNDPRASEHEVIAPPLPSSPADDPSVLHATSPAASPSRMLIKRSVSPDGRIDSLSVEFSCPVNGVRKDIEQHARRFLGLQTEIVDRFLNRNGQPTPAPDRRSLPDSDGAVTAQMLNIGGTDGKWGRRLFIRFRVDDRVLWHFGNQEQLSACLKQAGYPTLAEQVREDLSLNVVCRVVLKESEDGKYLNVVKVLPDARRAQWQ